MRAVSFAKSSMLLLTVAGSALHAQAASQRACPAVAASKSDLKALAIRDTATVKPSGWAEPAASVVFVNGACSGITVQWRDYYGKYRTFATLAAGDSAALSTYATHHFVVRTAAGTPLAFFVVPTGGGRAVVRAASAATSGRRG